MLVREEECGKCIGWKRWEGSVEENDGLRVAEAEAGLLVGDNGGPDRVDPGVAVGMVIVPVGIDEMLDRIGADGGEGIGDLRARRRDAGVDEKLALWAGKHSDVATRADKHADIAAELLGRDLRFSRVCAGLNDHDRWLGTLLGEERPRREISSSRSCGTGREEATA